MKMKKGNEKENGNYLSGQRYTYGGGKGKLG